MTMPESRSAVFSHALETLVGAGDADPSTLFTDDVQSWSPGLKATSLADLTEALDDREDGLSNVNVAIRSLHMGGNTLIAEWRVDADHTGPLTLNDDLTLPATGRHIHVGGATFAEFRGDKIRTLRSYFDDGALIEQLVGAD
jgi:predicted ester cyclase